MVVDGNVYVRKSVGTRFTRARRPHRRRRSFYLRYWVFYTARTHGDTDRDDELFFFLTVSIRYHYTLRARADRSKRPDVRSHDVPAT